MSAAKLSPESHHEIIFIAHFQAIGSFYNNYSGNWSTSWFYMPVPLIN